MRAFRSRSFLTLLLLASAGCSKSLTQIEDLTPSAPVNADANAGNWRMILLSGPSQFPVPAPDSATSGSYRAEIAAIRASQASLTDKQKTAIEYWAGGGVLRWNQLVRTLAAHYDLPPAPRDGAYPAPDAANPTADPQFPFSNPPYSARAYSYLSVAQFEALKVAWYYKYQYNRPSPARVDTTVLALAPATDLPAYPSEDGVLAGVSETLLKALYPASVDEITAWAAEQREAARLSGKASDSDIAAGQALGQAVAAVFLARARADGMGAAAGNPALFQSLADAATARGEVAWKSLETPPRPPMLANFGQVRAWMLTPAEIVSERPAAPPSTSSAQMKQELAEVKDTVDHLTREQLAICHKWADGVSTSSPPGHWNAIASDYVARARFSEVRAARVFALLNMVQHDAAVGCWEAKFAYFNPRPSQLDPSIRTVVGLPNFPSYTSGHSTFSAGAAAILSYVFPGGTAEFDAMKDEAAISRLYGGIHYRSDIEVGKDHGRRIAGYTLRFARQDGAD
jgi:hypothetical protein